VSVQRLSCGCGIRNFMLASDCLKHVQSSKDVKNKYPKSLQTAPRSRQRPAVSGTWRATRSKFQDKVIEQPVVVIEPSVVVCLVCGEGIRHSNVSLLKSSST
jgi:hypothetical protein